MEINFRNKLAVTSIAAIFTLGAISSCSDSGEKTTPKENTQVEGQDKMKMENIDHSNMKMDTKSETKKTTMFEGWNPTESVKVEGVKADFHIVNLAYANEMLKMVDEVYVESMHPHILSEKPGSCPICGMEMVKKKASEVVINTKGRTHHIDLILRDEKTGEKLIDAKTKLKIIAPDNNSPKGAPDSEYRIKSVEKTMTLHMGTWETDVDLKSPGKYGMIALARIGEKDSVFKFYFENSKPKTM